MKPINFEKIKFCLLIFLSVTEKSFIIKPIFPLGIDKIFNLYGLCYIKKLYFMLVHYK